MQSFRPDNIDCGTALERKRELKALREIEMMELGLRAPPRERLLLRSRMQKTRMVTLSVPRVLPMKHHEFQQSWRHRPPGALVQDKLLLPAMGEGRFWISRWTQITKQMINPIGEDQLTSEAFTTIIGILKRMMDKAATMPRCGILFDIVSTSSVINTGVPHLIGNEIYKHIDEKYYNLTQIKFVFVGITDNVNCKAARDVFCRDRTVGKEPKGNFETLDNVHMYIVFPGDPRHPGMIDSGDETLLRTHTSGSNPRDGGDFFVTEKDIGDDAGDV